LRSTVRRRLSWIAWIGLLLTLLSGAAWLVLVAQSISDLSIAEVLTQGALWTVLTETDFGRAWLLRLLLIALLVGLLAASSPNERERLGLPGLAIALTAAGLAGTLAWAGHGAGGSGMAGVVHTAADFLHLIAAAAWVGSLLPLAVLLAAAGRASAIEVARAASLRFSAWGVAAVGTLLLTGAINTWYLVGSVCALTETDYGKLLFAKIALFLGMVALATINRLWLTPALAAGPAARPAARPAQNALQQLRRNVVIEIAAGAVILAVVAVLGVTPPGFGE
jgi:copper resistance protein D